MLDGRDSWWPYGDGDMLRAGPTPSAIAPASIRRRTSDGVEADPKALRLNDYGLRVGAKADFLTLRPEHIRETVVSLPDGPSALALRPPATLWKPANTFASTIAPATLFSRQCFHKKTLGCANFRRI